MNVVLAELGKLRTVRATWWTATATVVVAVGFGALVAAGMREGSSRPFDPLFCAFYSLTVAQLALVVLAAGAMTSEFGSGTIRASLAAVPSRGRFYAAKLVATALWLAGPALVAVVATFGVTQALLGPLGVGLGESVEPLVGAWLYLVLIGLFALGVATLLRRATATLGILLPVFFLGSQGLGNVPGARVVLQYLPDQAGWVMLHLTRPGDPQFGRDYGAWGGLGIVALWTAVALAAGYLVLRRRDVH